ncbi:uncharacterized protein BT62DRAFT_649492 [Guyanagaster necrorhizus]|uniref:Uncharacterized protein n=1 Tax=Guyanagaster necrorhizus TaxID=856835 RepID=A0A9P7VH52_9AGAR|nr:uncharacterized protein BT62DRAFT_649492 [Guyanagaster necrorhizus MCA 3950]KAG7439976.1 hypothetical protein BT62DRAFT_649492 [Guyanagaster necrorhizus MCA 3950]
MSSGNTLLSFGQTSFRLNTVFLFDWPPFYLPFMDRPLVFDLRSSSARQSKSLHFPRIRSPIPRPEKPRSFLFALNRIRRRILSSLLSHRSPTRIPIPAPIVEQKVQSEVMVLSARPVNVQVKLVPRKVHYETVRRRQHREEPALHIFQPFPAPSRHPKRPSTAPQLQNSSSGKHADGFIRRKERKNVWSGEWNRTDIRDVINDLRSLR